MSEGSVKKQKQDVGLPGAFQISVPSGTEKPVDLGGYLDEVFEPSTNKVLPKAETTAREIPPVSEPIAAAEPEARKPVRLVEPPRKQVNMKPETIRKVEELLKIVRNRGPQRTTAMSEVFDALIGVLYDARDSIDFMGVPKRGQWGSATAAAYVAALGRVFGEAINRERRRK